MTRFVNLTNHKMSDDQRGAAAVLGATAVVDMPFPTVPADASEADIASLAGGIIDQLSPLADVIVHVMGESTLVFAVVSRIQAGGGRAVASTTERVSREVVNPDGSVTKTSEFRFVRFRWYF